MKFLGHDKKILWSEPVWGRVSLYSVNPYLAELNVYTLVNVVSGLAFRIRL